jgi:hypothetical protein
MPGEMSLHTPRHVRTAATPALVLLALVSSGCVSSQLTPMRAAQAVPAAEGQVTTAPADNGNLALIVTVQHLARPDRVAPGATTYVVWLQPSEQPTQNIGALEVDAELRGRLSTKTAHHDFTLFITAEQFPEVAAPTGVEVFRTTVRG